MPSPERELVLAVEEPSASASGRGGVRPSWRDYIYRVDGHFIGPFDGRKRARDGQIRGALGASL